MKPKALSSLLMLAAMVALSPSLTAQTQLYTLTNGTVQWHEKQGGSDYITPVGYHEGVPRYQTDGSDVTFKIERGNRYLCLDTNALDIVPVNSPTELCLWYRSGDVGYYWQDWNGYRYYLLGSPEDLRIEKIRIGQLVSTTTYWYNWSFGAGIDKSYVRDGEYNTVRYWMAYDGSSWVMSCDAIERPETILWLSSNPAVNNKDWYCPAPGGSAPACSAVVAMPVSLTDHPVDIVGHTSNVGLEDINLSADTLKYSFPPVTATPKYFSTAAGSYTVRPAYKEYTLETARDGINLLESGRTSDVYGAAGVPSTETKYVHANNILLVDGLPATTSMTLNPSDVVSCKYDISNEAKRYVSLSVTPDGQATLTCLAPPLNDMNVDIILTVTTSQGISESVVKQIVLSNYVNHHEKTESITSVFVGGSVFGGGRMADVDGNTDVTVHNCDTISYVFGGNDIGGRVDGVSNVLIGTENTTAEKPIDIGSVYGAGNGYYHYPNRSNGTNQPISTCHQYAAAENIMSFDGGTLVAENTSSTLYIPTIQRTTVTVNSNFAQIDTVFGGARNANIGYTTTSNDTSTSVRIHKGIIFSVFGGNNVGGCLPDNTFSGLYITGDSLGLHESVPIINSYWTKYGRDFGIRYVFGGGNRVFHNSAIRMSITGGMIDSVFAGGNSADVYRTICHVNCPTGGKRIYYNPTAIDNNADNWVGARGRYNIRALFGGNNLASMAILPNLKLESGGIGVVYGGGNAGDMVYNGNAGDTSYAADIVDVTFRDHLYTSLNYFTGDANTYIQKPTGPVSTYVHLMQNDSISIDYIYGGCRSANVLNSTLVDIDGGYVGAVFGGCNIAGDVGSTIGGHGRGMAGTYVVINDGKILNNVYGGANGYYHCAEGEQESAAKYVSGINFTDNEGVEFDAYDEHIGLYRPTHNYTHLLINGGTIFGNTYAGGNHAAVGFYKNTFKRVSGGVEEVQPCEQLAGGIHFAITGGTVKGNVFGGANMAQIYGLSYVHAMGDAVIEGSLYGGNDRLGKVMSNRPFYSVLQSNSYDMQASDGTLLNTSTDASATSKYATYIKIEGTPTINKVYGGGNGAYNYDGSHPEYDELEVVCTSDGDLVLPIEESTFIDVHVSNGGHIDTIFGGGNAVGIEKDVLVLINAADIDADAVGIIFGGNNMANMETCVPEVNLKKGIVGTVFGGSNMGHMKAYKDLTDACGQPVSGVSSYVYINSTDITVKGCVFGGCNKADVSGMSYVDIRNTSDTGIDTVFGGNDVSGFVRGNTRVDLAGGTVSTIYGGSNGYYDYVQVDHDDYAVYKFNHAGEPEHILYHNSIGSPIVAVTQVNIFGGTVMNNIYGGGRMGDCNVTNVIINDRACGDGFATIRGRVYGGGEGDTSRLDRIHRGNIKDSTHVELRHASDVIAYVYGGGKGGDVMNTNIYSYPTWEESFQKIFGGCWGANVLGTAHMDLKANETWLGSHPEKNTADFVFGGNDFSGSVYYSDLQIHSGRYGDIYGAGNGDFPSSNYVVGGSHTQVYPLFAPNNEYVHVTFNDGTVKGILFGGGRLGTTFRYLTDDNGAYICRNAAAGIEPQRIPDTNFTNTYLGTAATGLAQSYAHDVYSYPMDYSYIMVNVHGGTFEQDIFAGAKGQDNQLVYGVKILNMDGGYVEQSVYGGSQAVSDGYSRAECNATGSKATPSTKRPSSILNIVSGTVNNHVYGAGYKGYTHGSVYVNIGYDAVARSTVWNTAYAGEDSAYAIFMPNLEGSFSDSLVMGDLFLNASVYAGANWGQNDGSFVFSAEGFFGGESRILIDGNGYANSPIASGPTINIANSLFGSGTSVKGGDILSRIDVRNYGTIYNCGASKTLKSVQRADAYWVHNTGIRYDGTPDAISAFHTQNYSIIRVDTINTVGFNVVELNAPIAQTEVVRFWEDNTYVYDYDDSQLVLATTGALNQSNGFTCPADSNVCDLLTRVNPTSAKYTALVVNGGNTIDVSSDRLAATNPSNPGAAYGEVAGYAYLIAEKGTKPTIRARAKVRAGSVNWTDGGFSYACSEENKYTVNGNTWNTNNPSASEMQYTNYPASGSREYRYWAPGGGLSKREVVILAHEDPSVLPDDDKKIKLTGSDGTTDRELCLAHTVLTLPPTSQNVYYRLGQSGIIINDANSNMSLVDVSWAPTSWDATDQEWNAVETDGSWFVPRANEPFSTEANFNKEDKIQDDPNTTFGLVMMPKTGFSSTQPSNTSLAGANWTNGITSISPSRHTLIVNDYYTPSVSANNISPEMELFLTYDNSFFNAGLSSVKFVLVEYNANGTPTGDSIQVEVYVSTILNSFKDMEYDLIAKFNGGKQNTFTRRSVLPATLKQQQLYIDSVMWFPTHPSDVESGLPYEAGDPVRFILASDHGYVLDNSGEHFAVAIKPVENTSSDNLSAVGWYSIAADSTDVYSRVYDNNLGTSVSSGTNLAPVRVNVDDVMLGTLDGRGLAGLNFELFYDGAYKPSSTVYVGDVVLNMYAQQTGSDQKERFTITLHVQIRPGGDTIYVASAPSITRTNMGNTYTVTPGSVAEGINAGKRPGNYLRTLDEAMAVYTEGDVICIIDTLDIKGSSTAVNLMGSADSPIKVIRYEGHHTDLPGEGSVYRGPMIRVSDNASFTTQHIDFQGSAAGINLDNGVTASPVYETMTKQGFTHVVTDTNIAFGPIIAVSNSGKVDLREGTIVEQNYNGYNGSDISRYGALNVTNGGELRFTKQVTVQDNLTPPNTTTQSEGVYYPLSGAVYVNGGIVRSANNCVLTLINNHEYAPGDGTFNKKTLAADGESMGCEFDNTNTSNGSKSNLYLTRTVGAGDAMLSDAMSSVFSIYPGSTLSKDSRIGVSKWFPGLTVRDTICIVYATAADNDAKNAFDNSVFSSDDDYMVGYSTGVQPRTIYLVRCASFKHQEASSTPIAGTDVLPKDALEFIPDPSATCPNGRDMLYYRVQGGFFPYTYTWTGVEPYSGRQTTPASNTTVWNEYNNGNKTSYLSSITDSAYLPIVQFTPTQNSDTLNIKVEAYDAFGCRVFKNVEIVLRKTGNSSDPAFEKTGNVAYWTEADTNSAHVAKGNRNYTGVKITAYAWPDRDAASISAAVRDVSSNTTFIYLDQGNSEFAALGTARFCEGDTINLAAAPEATNSDCDAPYHFVMWDFNPYMPSQSPQSNYVVPAYDVDVVAYYAPSNYWKDVSANVEESSSYYFADNGADYVTAYNGDVHIYTEAGLGWFINVVNGTRGNVARPFYFNKVYLHQKTGGYDMKCHLWTPVGAPLYPFRGWFQGVGSTYNDTTALPEGSYVTIKNLIVDEPDLTSAGFFGYLDTARIKSIRFEGAMIRGSQYVGTLAGQSVDARINNVVVESNRDHNDSDADAAKTTVLTTHNISGGLIGKSTRDIIKNYQVSAKYIGDAVYSGGLLGYAENPTVSNGGTRNDTRLSGIYIGGIAGWVATNTPPGPAKSATGSLIANNYVKFTTNGVAMRTGGVVGYAQGATVTNNYVYGHVDGGVSTGGVGAVLANNARVNHNYYAKSDAKQAVGLTMGNVQLEDISSFDGRGNAVTLSDRVYGVDNLTRVLNIWVREQNANGADYRTWTSDLTDANSGYPVFGEPDLIPVHETITLDGCEEVIWEGITYNTDQTLVVNVVDSVQMIDSTLSTIIRVHHATATDLTDTAQLGVDYSGHGFHVSAAESSLLRQSLDESGRATLVLTDTLHTEFGCDSVVTLTLTFTFEGIVDVSPVVQVKVFPNPTTDQVNVEAEEMTRVEVYDNEGRRLQSLEGYGNSRLTLSLGNYPAGVYYIRVHAPSGVTIQKVIKR